MDTNVIVRVTDDKQLKIPSEIQSQLQPGDEYKIVITKNAIVLEKVTKPEVDIDGFLEEIEELEPDPYQPSLEEISEVVKEVRLTIKSSIEAVEKPGFLKKPGF